MTARTLLPLVGLLAAGCADKSNPPAVPPPPPAVAPAETIDNPDYANWSRFAPGTVVVRKSVSEREGRKTTSTETLRLAEKSDAQVLVDRQNTTERDDGYKAVNPSEQRKYVKSFGLPAGMTADDFHKPSRKAKLAGEEKLTVLGKEYTAKVYKWTEGTEAGEMAVTVWQVDDLPGRVAKQTMVVAALKTTTTDEVIELRVTP